MTRSFFFQNVLVPISSELMTGGQHYSEPRAQVAHNEFSREFITVSTGSRAEDCSAGESEKQTKYSSALQFRPAVGRETHMAGLPLGVKCSACFCMSGRGRGRLAEPLSLISWFLIMSLRGDKLANKGGKSNKMKWVGKAWQVWTHQLEIVARLLCFREIPR